MAPDDPSIHEHETRISLLEQNCDRCPEKFRAIFTKLDEMSEAQQESTIETLKAIADLKIKHARASGFRAAMWGGGAGGAAWAIGKLIAIIAGRA